MDGSKKKRIYISIVEAALWIGLLITGIVYQFKGQNLTFGDFNLDPGVTYTYESYALKKGTYSVTINYSAPAEGASIYADSEKRGMGFMSQRVYLEHDYNTRILEIEAYQDLDDFTIYVENASNQPITVFSTEVVRNNDYVKRLIFFGMVLVLLIELWNVFFFAERSKKIVSLALLFMAITATFPFYQNSVPVGHDLSFHLLRTESMFKAIKDGQFPVKLNPIFVKDYGYALGTFYGDALLYIQVVLRVLGLNIMQSYKVFVFIINLFTAMVSFFSFKKIFKTDRSGIAGALLYTLAPYRLLNIYTRGDVGETCAMLFFPLVFTGFYLVLKDAKDKEKKASIKDSFMIAIGLAGVLYSHTISCVLLVPVIFITLLIFIKRVFNWETFKTLLYAFLIFVGLSLSFLVPFLLGYADGIMMQNPEWGVGTGIREYGMMLTQIFAIFTHANGGTWTTLAGAGSEITVTIGIVPLIAFVVIPGSRLINKKKENENFFGCTITLVLFALTCFMSTCYFPWHLVDKLFLFKSIEFPWRFLSIATLLGVFITVYVYENAREYIPEVNFKVFIGVVIVLMTVQTADYFYQETLEADSYRVIGTDELNTMQIYGGDLLPEGTNINEIAHGLIRTEGLGGLEGFKKDGLWAEIYLRSGMMGGEIDFPLLYERGYKAYCVETGEKLNAVKGYNNMVHVDIPENFEGTVRVKYSQPIGYRVAQIISLLTACFMVFVSKYNRRKK